MSIQTLRVNRELLSILNHTGLNPNDAVEVETGVSKGKFVSIVSGVDVPCARAEILRHFEGRQVSVQPDDKTEYLIVTQPYRE